MKLRTLMVAAVAALMITPVTAQEMREYTDALGRTVEIPADPQRIVGLWDQDITTPLIELGAPVVGSHGRSRAGGSNYIRAAETILGVSFDNSDIEYVGTYQDFDLEAIASLEPDLIIARNAEIDLEDHLGVIAPVVFLDRDAPALDNYEAIADIVGKTERFETLNAKFQKLLEDAAAWVGDNSYTYTIVQAEGSGNINVYADYSMMSYIVEALGFTIVGEGARLREAGENRVTTSPEILPEQDADFVFGNYRIDMGSDGGPHVEDAALNDALQGYCQFLPACADGRLILLPREFANAPSFQAWEALTHVIVSNVAGRPGITVPN